jgi:pyroglutamyl-peptidase
VYAGPVHRVLLTGFEPFGGEPINPSWLAVERLEGAEIGGASVVARRLPCVFGEAMDVLRREIEAHDPVLVICTGQAGGRDGVSLERIAIDVDDASIADNAGQQPIDRPIVEGGPVGYWSTLPIKSAVSALRAAGLSAHVSQTAGTFVCNHVFYGLMHLLDTRGSDRRGLDGGGLRTRGGFVHVPFLPEQSARHGDAPNMALEDIVRALRIVVEVSLSQGSDLRLAGGATH